MTRRLARRLAAAAALSCAAQMAAADVTPAEVWSDIRSRYEAMGYGIAATETLQGDTVVLTDFVLTFDLPEIDGRVTSTLSTVEFAPAAGGTVAIALPDSVPIVIEGAPEDGETFETSLTFAQSGQDVTASGVPGAIDYAYAAKTADVTLDGIVVDGTPIGADAARFRVATTGLALATRIDGQALDRYDLRSSADLIEYDLGFRDPDTSESVAFAGRIGGMASESTATVPPDMASGDTRALVDAGLRAAATIAFAEGETRASGETEDGAFGYTSRSQGGELDFALDAERFAYRLSQRDMAVELVTDDVPFPVGFGAGEVALALSVPIAETDAEQDFATSLRIGALSFPDTVWAIFDPAAALPRDPATMVIDLVGKVRLLGDILAEPPVTPVPTGPDLELTALTLRALDLDALGAQVTGTGDFTFDPADTNTFGGYPKPTGALDLRLVGLNALIERLIAMGILPEQNGMAARMMMGVLGTPTGEPDTLTSRLEITEEGQILANGQRIQ